MASFPTSVKAFTRQVDGQSTMDAADVNEAYDEIEAIESILRMHSVPYRVYSALVTQVGTNAPTAVVLENTLGGTPVWVRMTSGIYRAILTGAFPEDKVFLPACGVEPDSDALTAMMLRLDDDTLQLVTYSPASGGVDNFRAHVEMRVYG